MELDFITEYAYDDEDENLENIENLENLKSYIWGD